ncbi:MAG: helix-turn-helix domain-containing protein [Micropepsaceae bacterium]
MTSSYRSPLRAAQKEETRQRIVAAAFRLLETSDPGALSFAAIAEAAGVQERTIYRHFANKEALLEALWGGMDARIGVGAFPGNEAELIAFPPKAFEAFDESEGLIRALWSAPQGRDFWMRVNDLRKRSMRGAAAEAVKRLPRKEAEAVTAAVQLLYSAGAWLMMKEYWGFTGKQAGEASSLAIEMLLEAARRRGGKGEKT